MPVAISIRADLKAFQNSLDSFTKRQMPFATALALTEIAKRVKAAEQKNMRVVFDGPTPFTLNSIGIKSATKANQTATVYVKDIAAAYLAPFEEGGKHFLGSKKGLLTPIEQAVNQYGNLPRGTLAKLKAMPNVYIGPVKTASGLTINGVWQRIEVKAGRRPPKLKARGSLVHSTRQGTLKLLIKFSDPKPVKQRLNYRQVATKTVAIWVQPELRAAMRKAMAMATAR